MQVELAHFADPAIGALLTERGYRLTSFENVLGLARTTKHEQVMPPSIEVRPSSDDELDHWLDVVADAIAYADTQGLPSHEEFPREIVVNAMRDMAAAGVNATPRYTTASSPAVAAFV